MSPRARSLKKSTPLSSTKLDVLIADLVAEFVVNHSFRNDSDAPIEAVFSFPIPLDAAFLAMRATLAGETLTAQICPQQQASRTYDDAIASGHSAVLLRNPEPGVLCTSLGNLLPGEQGEIELRFANPLRVADRSARFSLPLVHRPRYGNWGLEELEAPTHDFAVEHPMSASIRVTGLLASAPVTCATHAARFASSDGQLELSISEAMLDRDLVLIFELSQDLPPVAKLVDDAEQAIGLVSLVLPTSQHHPKPLDLCLVLDCSGSMSGDAIEQSRVAVQAVIASLEAADRIQVIRFGSSVRPMFRRPLRATPQVCNSLRELISTINADLGGTDMGVALERSLLQLGAVNESRSRAVVLVTDGAVQPDDVAEAAEAAASAGVRIFVVAVGSSAGAEVLAPMAESTGAVMERSVPGESIDAGVMRQFRRARELGPLRVEVQWPTSVASPIPMGLAYPGDAITLAAILPRESAGRTVVRVASCSYEISLDLGAIVFAPQARALIGQRRYLTSPSTTRAQIALRYGLLTEETSAVLVKERTDGTQSSSLPTIVQVPQMVSRGMVMSACAAGAAASVTDLYSASASLAAPDSDLSDFDRPAFSRRMSQTRDEPKSDTNEPMLVVTITPDAARTICESLRVVLAKEWRIDPSRVPTLGAAITGIPSDLQERAVCLFYKFKLSLDRPSASVRLLFALDSILGYSTMSDEDEAAYSLVLAQESAAGDEVDSVLIAAI
jgi:Ca-activated chloride channel family protein